MERGWVLTACLLLCASCGSDGDEGGGNGSDSAELQTCYDLCSAQDAAEMANDCPGIGLGVCRALCTQLEGSACWSEQTDLNACQLTGEFGCGLISAESDADCETELAAYEACSTSSSTACTGANEDGFCPSVPCACPDGDTMISGIITDGAQCMCADSTTCTEFCF